MKSFNEKAQGMTTPYDNTDVAENLKDLEYQLRVAPDDRARLCILFDVGDVIGGMTNERWAQLTKDHFYGLGADRHGLDPREMEDQLGDGIAKGRRRLEENRKLDGKTVELDTKKQWPDPCPLPEALLPVDPFDFNLLPEQLRSWGADVADRMQCAPDFVAVSIMAALGSVIGPKIAIRPKAHDDWQEVPNQWAMLIGRPGVLKSPAMQEALRPLKGLCAEASRKFKEMQDGYGLDAQIAKLQADAAIKKAGEIFRSKDSPSEESKQKARDLLAAKDGPSEPPTLRRYIANDTNIASLGALLQQNPNGLLVFRDEVVSLLRSLDQEERADEKSFYLTGWGGHSSYTFDRISRGFNLSIDRVCLSLLGSTQPGVISEYLSQAIRGGRRDDGLMQRFGLLVWPDTSGEWRHVDRWPDKGAQALSSEVFNRLDKLDWKEAGAQRDRGLDGDEDGLPYLRFNIEAYDLFVEWRKDLEKRLRGDLHPALESHLAKYRKLVPSLALIDHLVDGGKGPVGMAALARAIGWAKYLETHARRAYGSATFAEAATARAIFAKIRSGDLKSEFSSRDVWRPQWSKLTDRNVVGAGLRLLVDYDHVFEAKTETAGRPAVVYTVNPKALARASIR
jgi:putative DNA primase/helicase